MKFFSLTLLTFLFCSANLLGQTKDPDIKKADSLFSAHDFSGALQLYSILIDHYGNGGKESAFNDNPGRFYWRRGICYNYLKNSPSAIVDLTVGLPYYKQDDKRRSSLLLDRGRFHSQANNYKAAIGDFNDALLANSENNSALIERAFAYKMQHNDQSAIDDYTKAIFSAKLTDVQTALAFAFRADCKASLKQYREALNDFNEALVRNPDLKIAYMLRAHTLQQHGDYELSNLDYTKALELYKDDSKTLSRIYQNRAFNYRRLYKFELAMEDIDKGLPLALNPGVLYWSRASLYSESGQCHKAIDGYKQTMEYYKDDKGIEETMHLNIANEYYVLKNFPNTLKECKAALVLDSADYSVYFLMGKLYLKHLSKPDLAVKCFNKVLELDTAKSSTSYIFSQFYLGNKALAIDLLHKEVLRETTEAEVATSYYNIACMFSIMNDAENANTYLKKVISSGYPKQFAANDEDLDNIRNTPDYISTMATPILK